MLGEIGDEESAYDMFVDVQVAVEGEGWMVGVKDKMIIAYLNARGCVQRNLYLNCVSLWL